MVVLRWLGNYFIIFGVNIVFGGAAAVCLFNKVHFPYAAADCPEFDQDAICNPDLEPLQVTHRAQVEIWRRLTQFLLSLRQQVGFEAP